MQERRALELRLFILAAALVCAQAANGQGAAITTFQAPISTSNPGYLLATFQNPQGSGVTGGTLSLYQSYDAVAFFWNGLPSYNCLSAVRDPNVGYWAGNIVMGHTGTGGSMTCNPDTHHINFTSATGGTTAALSFANTSLYNCVSSGLCWSPWTFFDRENCTFTHGTGSSAGWTCSSSANVHVYFANSTQSTCCSSFTLYAMHCTASDCFTNTSHFSTPVALSFSSGSFVPIDPSVECMNTSTYAPCSNPTVTGDTYFIWWNDKSSSTGCLNYGSMTGPEGPTITVISTGLCFGMTNYLEAPNIFYVGSNTWQICADNYANSYDQGNLNCAYSTNGWSTWKPAMNFFLQVPTQAKHGNIIQYP